MSCNCSEANDFKSMASRILNSLNIPLSVETVCVFTAPVFSAFAAWATYFLTKVCFLLDIHVSGLYQHPFAKLLTC